MYRNFNECIQWQIFRMHIRTTIIRMSSFYTAVCIKHVMNILRNASEIFFKYLKKQLLPCEFTRGLMVKCE